MRTFLLALLMALPMAKAGPTKTYPFFGFYRVSQAFPAGLLADDNSAHPSVSGDGRYVVFESSARRLVYEDTNDASDIFLFDTLTSTTSLVSVSSDGTQGNAKSFSPSISGNGRYVAFVSLASNLVAGTTNGKSNIFIRDLETQTTINASTTSLDGLSDGDSDGPSLSDDGRYVGFMTDATNLGDASDTNDKADFIIKDLVGGTNTRVSVSSSEAEGDEDVVGGQISGDGQFAVFTSLATNMVSGDSNSCADVFVRDISAGTTALMSVNSSGTIGNRLSSAASISTSGRYVVFESRAGNLVSGDTNGRYDVFLRDRTAGTIERVSVKGSVAAQVSYDSRSPRVSADGRFVVFQSLSPQFDASDNNKSDDVIIRDRTLNDSQSLTATSAKVGDSWSREPVISSDGRRIVFSSRASNFEFPAGTFYSDIFYQSNNMFESVVQVAKEDDLGDVAGVQAGFRFTRTGDIASDAVVSYTVGGTAVANTDYSALPGQIVIPAGDDHAILPISILGGVTAGRKITITIIDAPPVHPGVSYYAENTIQDIVQYVVNIATIDPLAMESNSGQKGKIRISRDNVTASSLTVDYTISGTATNGTDYTTLSGSATIPASQAYVDIEIAAIADMSDEGTETVQVDLSPDSAYILGENTTAFAFIEDSPCSLFLGNKCIFFLADPH